VIQIIHHPITPVKRQSWVNCGRIKHGRIQRNETVKPVGGSSLRALAETYTMPDIAS
jgi:hypothetical protein